MSYHRHLILIVSAFIPITFLFLLDLLSLFVICLSGFDFAVMIPVGLLGLVGFYGFGLLISENYLKKKLVTMFALVCGLAACLLTADFLEIEFDDILFKTFSSFSDFMTTYFLFWPNFVALYFIIFLSIKLIIDKASN